MIWTDKGGGISAADYFLAFFLSLSGTGPFGQMVGASEAGGNHLRSLFQSLV